MSSAIRDEEIDFLGQSQNLEDFSPADPEEGDDLLQSNPSSGEAPVLPALTTLSDLKGSVSDTKGRPRVLTVQDTVQAWDDYVLGSNIVEIARKFHSTPALVTEALDIMARELGYPDNHLDPEMERFRIVEASDRTKASITRCLKDSNEVLKQYEEAKKKIVGNRNLAELEESELKKVLALNKARQEELKIVGVFLGECRQINTLIAEITGVRRSKPTRKEKKVGNQEEILEGMSDEDLRRLAANESS